MMEQILFSPGLETEVASIASSYSERVPPKNRETQLLYYLYQKKTELSHCHTETRTKIVKLQLKAAQIELQVRRGERDDFTIQDRGSGVYLLIQNNPSEINLWWQNGAYRENTVLAYQTAQKLVRNDLSIMLSGSAPTSALSKAESDFFCTFDTALLLSDGKFIKENFGLDTATQAWAYSGIVNIFGPKAIRLLEQDQGTGRFLLMESHAIHEKLHDVFDGLLGWYYRERPPDGVDSNFWAYVQEVFFPEAFCFLIEEAYFRPWPQKEETQSLEVEYAIRRQRHELEHLKNTLSERENRILLRILEFAYHRQRYRSYDFLHYYTDLGAHGLSLHDIDKYNWEGFSEKFLSYAFLSLASHYIFGLHMYTDLNTRIGIVQSLDYFTRSANLSPFINLIAHLSINKDASYSRDYHESYGVYSDLNFFERLGVFFGSPALPINGYHFARRMEEYSDLIQYLRSIRRTWVVSYLLTQYNDEEIAKFTRSLGGSYQAAFGDFDPEILSSWADNLLAYIISTLSGIDIIGADLKNFTKAIVAGGEIPSMHPNTLLTLDTSVYFLCLAMRAYHLGLEAFKAEQSRFARPLSIYQGASFADDL